MEKHYETLLEGIHNKKILILYFMSKEKGLITRRCIPFDFGISRRYKDDLDRFHFYDLDSPDGNHNLSILPEQINSLTITNENFTPKDYVSWKPNWIIKRDWGIFS
ncbi:hypothetical protein J2Y38_000513 [Flavobacterium sp. 2755]|uniref:hypothetical protein n=1 Tax=Flavobacterium sp. 2755 TaxID=2817765 RepID=UPI00285A40A3|nr:hypothetical protein [Flavobacterium sp. 2755]MDR6760334.1 hypothetical protein [Flavobacterium sp. 2755]